METIHMFIEKYAYTVQTIKNFERVAVKHNSDNKLKSGVLHEDGKVFTHACFTHVQFITQICHIVQQKAVWFERDFCVSDALCMDLLPMANKTAT